MKRYDKFFEVDINYQMPLLKEVTTVPAAPSAQEQMGDALSFQGHRVHAVR